MKTVIIPLALSHPDDSKCRGAYLRLLTGILHEDRRSTVVIQTAGYCKENPRHAHWAKRSLCEAMKDKLEGEMHPWAENFIARPLTWSTRGEIRYGLKVIRQMKIATSRQSLNIIISSNLLHLLRIRWYVWMYTPWAWKVTYKTSWHPFGWKDRLLEIPKHIQALYFFCQRHYHSRVCVI